MILFVIRRCEGLRVGCRTTESRFRPIKENWPTTTWKATEGSALCWAYLGLRTRGGCHLDKLDGMMVREKACPRAWYLSSSTICKTCSLQIFSGILCHFETTMDVNSHKLSNAWFWMLASVGYVIECESDSFSLLWKNWVPDEDYDDQMVLTSVISLANGAPILWRRLHELAPIDETWEGSSLSWMAGIWVERPNINRHCQSKSKLRYRQ